MPLFSDPCWITYTIALTDDPRIVPNVESGLMVPIMEDVPRAAAQAGLRTFGRYFDDEPDGIVKLTSCEPDDADDGSGTSASPAPHDIRGM